MSIAATHHQRLQHVAVPVGVDARGVGERGVEHEDGVHGARAAARLQQRGVVVQAQALAEPVHNHVRHRAQRVQRAPKKVKGVYMRALAPALADTPLRTPPRSTARLPTALTAAAPQ